jgi:hypothetical protein
MGTGYPLITTAGMPFVAVPEDFRADNLDFVGDTVENEGSPAHIWHT